MQKIDQKSVKINPFCLYSWHLCLCLDTAPFYSTYYYSSHFSPPKRQLHLFCTDQNSKNHPPPHIKNCIDSSPSPCSSSPSDNPYKSTLHPLSPPSVQVRNTHARNLWNTYHNSTSAVHCCCYRKSSNLGACILDSRFLPACSLRKLSSLCLIFLDRLDICSKCWTNIQNSHCKDNVCSLGDTCLLKSDPPDRQCTTAHRSKLHSSHKQPHTDSISSLYFCAQPLRYSIPQDVSPMMPNLPGRNLQDCSLSSSSISNGLAESQGTGPFCSSGFWLFWVPFCFKWLISNYRTRQYHSQPHPLAFKQVISYSFMVCYNHSSGSAGWVLTSTGFSRRKFKMASWVLEPEY